MAKKEIVVKLKLLRDTIEWIYPYECVAALDEAIKKIKNLRNETIDEFKTKLIEATTLYGYEYITPREIEEIAREMKRG